MSRRRPGAALTFAQIERRNALSHARLRAATAAPKRDTDAFAALIGAIGSDFQGAEWNRLVFDWATSIKQPDDEIRGVLRPMRARARDLKRNDGHAKGFTNMVVSNVAGPYGFTLQAQIRQRPGGPLLEEVNRTVEDGFARWARRPVTVDRRYNLIQLEHQLLRTVPVDGEVFARMITGFRGNRFRFAIQALDADLLDERYTIAAGTRQTEIRMGVEVDEWGGRLGYHFSERPSFPNGQPGPRYRVPAEEVLHAFIAERGNQTRGYSWFAPAMLALRILHGYNEAELVAARIAAAKSFAIEREADAPTPPDGEPPNKPLNMNAETGSGIYLNPGETFKPWTPEHPTTAYPAYIKTVMRWIANGLGVSSPAFANDPEGVNFSSMRSFLLLERDLWQVLQQWWIAMFRQPLYEAWLNAAILSGQIVLPPGLEYSEQLFEVDWIPRGWDWVDPEKDLNSQILAIQWGLGSRTEFNARRGVDTERVFQQLEDEAKLAKKYRAQVSGPAPEPSTEKDPEDEPDDTGGGGDEEGDAARDGSRPRTTVANRLPRDVRRNGKVHA